MKCPKCNTNHPKKYGQRCNCGYTFVFNPERDHGWTDGKFLALLNRASHNGTYYYTKNQLLTYARKKKKLSAVNVLGLLVMTAGTGFFLSAVLQSGFLGIFISVIVLGGTLLFKTKMQSKPLTEQQLDSMITKWLIFRRTINKLVHKPALHTPPPEWNEKDIYDYGVEKILIVQHDVLVDVLVLNKLHTEQRMLIMSAGGYPEYLIPRLKKIVAEHPSPLIMALHDTLTEEQGRRFIAGIRDKFNLGQSKILDLGLYQENAEYLFKATKTKREKMTSHIPADYVPYPLLSSLLLLSVERNAVFADILEEVTSGRFEGSDAMGSFG